MAVRLNDKNIWEKAYEMKLGEKIMETVYRDSYESVSRKDFSMLEILTRVPGGWILTQIHSTKQYSGPDVEETSAVFIPFSQEFTKGVGE